MRECIGDGGHAAIWSALDEQADRLVALKFLRDQLLFPEIDYMKVDKARGMNVSVVTTAKTDEEARKLLQMPCRRPSSRPT